MVADALIKANPYYRFDEAIFEPKRYINLVRDELLTVIKRSAKPQLQEAAEILKRIEIRDLYKLAGEAIVTKEVRSKIKATDIVSWQENSSLKASDLVVHCFRLDWGNGEEYPLDSMVFFESEKPDVTCKMHLNKNETSQYRP